MHMVGKRLPFPGTFRYQMKTDSYQTITTGLQKMPTKTAVIDDAGYLLTNTFMKGHSAPKAGSSTFDLYNDIADNFWRLLFELYPSNVECAPYPYTLLLGHITDRLFRGYHSWTGQCELLFCNIYICRQTRIT